MGTSEIGARRVARPRGSRVDCPRFGHWTRRNHLVVRSRIRIGEGDSRLNSRGRVAPARVRPWQHADDA